MSELPNGLSAVVEHLAGIAAEYSDGLKWNEEHKLLADMMNMPARWIGVDPDQLHRACLEAGMAAEDAMTVSGFLRDRRLGKWFEVRGTYRDFHFMPVVHGVEWTRESLGSRE
ncbi:hypothetical protein [Leucobacter japonicus]|uniref:hypothetical protein n=1 Tax=Leucobacter japonicus TaxID=1461259 RepID=UPI0012E19E9A|nr:hypothetical protein [Leucobacter japonicus]